MAKNKAPGPMDLATILSSPSQRRAFLLSTILVLALGSLSAMLVAHNAPPTPVWSAFVGLLVSVAAGGVFALISGIYVWYFFANHDDVSVTSYVFPEDISYNLEDMARSSEYYKIFVRTGRHFRAKILPILVEKACISRSPLRLDVVLLDFRDSAVCKRYSGYRRVASFDRNAWSADYVRDEILATALEVLNAVHSSGGLVSANLYLSGRLSTFRIEGSADSLMVTREDPKDAAFRYHKGQSQFAAYCTEFQWIMDEAECVASSCRGMMPSSLTELFGEAVLPPGWEITAGKVAGASSPYVR